MREARENARVPAVLDATLGPSSPGPFGAEPVVMVLQLLSAGGRRQGLAEDGEVDLLIADAAPGAGCSTGPCHDAGEAELGAQEDSDLARCRCPRSKTPKAGPGSPLEKMGSRSGSSKATACRRPAPSDTRWTLGSGSPGRSYPTASRWSCPVSRITTSSHRPHCPPRSPRSGTGRQCRRPALLPGNQNEGAERDTSQHVQRGRGYPHAAITDCVPEH